MQKQHKLSSALKSIGLALAALLFTATLLSQPSPVFAQSSVGVGQSGLALPRFVSLKSDRVNVRVGPGRDHDIAWTFVKGGLPVEVYQESDNWRRIRDAQGNVGWVFHSLLSGRRTALVTPWVRNSEPVPLYRERNIGAKLNARLEPGVMVNIEECDGQWCRGDVENADEQTFRGFVQQDKLWGVYPDEKFEN